MTKEELEQEAEERAKDYTENKVRQVDYECGFLDGADVFKKENAELIRKLKTETELSKRLGVAYREYEQLTKEQDEHLAELEKENERLTVSYETLKLHDEEEIGILKSENAELKADNDARKFAMVMSENVEKQLREENAELKEQRLTTLKEQQTGIQKYALNLEHKLGWYDEQLTKATDIIKKFSEFVNNEVEYGPEHPQEHTALWNELCKEAEQFLNSEPQSEWINPARTTNDNEIKIK